MYSPYQFMPPNLVHDERGPRTLSADEREVLLDFKRRHTLACMHTGARKAAPQALELTRCGLLGDTFSCGVVAWVLQHLFHAEGYLDRVRTVEEMRMPSRGEPVQHIPEEELPMRLAQAHISQANPRGSDVRVDSGEVADTRSWPRRPIDVDRWKWKTDCVTEWQQDEHITFLEVLAGHLSLVWRTS